jgi:hypothetical protein
MIHRFYASAFIAAALLVTPIRMANAQENSNNLDSPIKFEVVQQLLNSNVRHSIGLKDLNGDNLPDLVIGSNAHRFDQATQSINADPNASFRATTPVPDHYQVSVHFNATKNASVSLGGNPKLQVPITASELVVPPG